MLLNQGDGALAEAVMFDAGDGSGAVAIGDLDGVHGPDLAVANRDSDDLAVLLNCSACSADVDGSGAVGMDDLVSVIEAWGDCPAPCPPSCIADVNGDCTVDVNDLIAVIVGWGACP